MGRESIILGVILIFLAAFLFYLGTPTIPCAILSFFGIILIIFSSAEDKIEERKDIKNKHTKK